MTSEEIKSELLDINQLHDSIQGLIYMKNLTTNFLTEQGLNHNFMYNMRKYYPRSDSLYILYKVLDVPMESLITGKDYILISEKDEIEILNLFKKLSANNKELLINMAKNIVDAQK